MNKFKFIFLLKKFKNIKKKILMVEWGFKTYGNRRMHKKQQNIHTYNLYIHIIATTHP